MVYQYKFSKILTLKEREKEDAYSKYSQALKHFEEVAEKLFRLLKKKEDLLEFQEKKLVNGLSVDHIRHHQSFIGNLEKIIDHCQKEVIEARTKLNLFQSLLIEKNVEVKKYEKIKEKDFSNFLEIVKENDNRQMDEISIQQFVSKEN
ncbi:flagellar export protein FliJ [Peribacillus alkalitolerans]|uniref:flagellar export protein FliJ n=1 Tax=Peribacillus alkalitolerans TaxID=1550385 RepID=UPI0013D28DC7|nr:flagellar export protein FliJ [Peribacillus alkalitolerans]